MSLNAEKCRIMHIGSNNPDHRYTISSESERVELSTTTCERDLGIQVSNNLKWHAQAANASCRANIMLGIIKKTFKKLNIQLTRRLFCCFVRPIIEYAAPAWSAEYAGDLRMLEKVQRRATKIPAETRELRYSERLEKFNLPTVKECRIRGDLTSGKQVATQ
jgi:ribonucleases P/MRP protein subunit RPP40